MRDRLRTGLVLAAAALLLTGILAYVVRDTTREVIIVRLARWVWAAHVLSMSVPRVLVWFALLAVGIWVALRSLTHEEKVAPLSTPRQALTPPPGPVETEMRWIRLAGQGSYGRWRLAQRLVGLLAETIASREQTGPLIIRQALQRGTVDLPPTVRDYAQMALGSMLARSARSFLAPWLRSGTETRKPLDMRDAEQVIHFLERELEVRHDE